jgi:hypothetical protein
MLQDIRARIEEFGETRRARIPPVFIHEVMTSCYRLEHILELPEGKDPTRAHFEEAQMHVRRIEQAMGELLMASGFAHKTFAEAIIDSLRRSRKLE